MSKYNLVIFYFSDLNMQFFRTDLFIRDTFIFNKYESYFLLFLLHTFGSMYHTLSLKKSGANKINTI